jgi:hypothetical protein
MKINWGTGIVISMVLFMIFILYFVYKSLTPEYTHELVSEDYYKDELHYQKEIDKLNNAVKLESKISLKNSEKGITIQFPDSLNYQDVKGNISFQRYSNSVLDFSRDIDLTSNKIVIPDSLLVSGKWIIKIDWNYKGEEFLFKDSWFY